MKKLIIGVIITTLLLTSSAIEITGTPNYKLGQKYSLDKVKSKRIILLLDNYNRCYSISITKKFDNYNIARIKFEKYTNLIKHKYGNIIRKIKHDGREITDTIIKNNKLIEIRLYTMEYDVCITIRYVDLKLENK